MNGFCPLCGKYTEGARHECAGAGPVQGRAATPVGAGQLPVYARPVFPPEVLRQAEASQPEAPAPREPAHKGRR